jgi:hypothetical protein
MVKGICLLLASIKNIQRCAAPRDHTMVVIEMARELNDWEKLGFGGPSDNSRGPSKNHV